MGREQKKGTKFCEMCRYKSLYITKFLPEGTKVNKKYYFQVMHQLRQDIEENARICGKIDVVPR